MDSALSENSILKEQFQRLMALQDLDKQIQGWDLQRLELAQKVEVSKAEVARSIFRVIEERLIKPSTG